MNPDPVIAETRKAKEAIAARHGFDVRKLAADLRKRQAAGTRRLTKPSPRRPQAVTAKRSAPVDDSQQPDPRHAKPLLTSSGRLLARTQPPAASGSSLERIQPRGFEGT